MASLLAVVIVVTLILLILLRLRPSLGAAVGGRILGVVSLVVLPLVAMAFGVSVHLERAKTTEFCLSCHVMEPYGRSLQIDSPDHLPASHFQNRRVDPELACYSCHTSYTMFGDVRAKLNGARHVLVNYLGTPPEPLQLYEPYHNRECLYCHGGARTYEENELHADLGDDLADNVVSCLECHDLGHDVEALATFELWEPGGGP